MKDLFLFNGSTVSLVGRVSASAPEDGQGFIAAGIDANSFLWLLSADGGCYGLPTSSIPTSGSLVTIPLIQSLPASEYSSGVANATEAGFFALSAAGEVYKVTSSGYSSLANLQALPRYPSLYDGQLFIPLPREDKVSTLVLSSSAVSSQASGDGHPGFCSAFSGGLWVASESAATFSEATDGVSFSDASGVTLSGNTLSYVTGTDPDLSVVNSLTLSFTPIDFIFIPNLSQVAVLGSSDLYIYSITDSELALSQTISISGPSHLALTPDGEDILVTSSSNSTISVVTESVGTWSVASTISSTYADLVWCGVTPTTTKANPALVVGSSSTIEVLIPSGSSWVSSFTVSVSGIVSSISGDGTNTVVTSYDSSSGESYIYLLDFSGNSISATLTVSGEVIASVSIEKYNFAFLKAYVSASDPAEVLIIRALSGDLTQIGTTDVSGDPTVLSWTGYSLWVGESQYQLTGSGQVEPVFIGYASLVTSSATTSYTLGRLNIPAALSIGATNAVVVCANNKIFMFPKAGGSMVEYDLGVFTGQKTGTPLNLSGIVIQAKAVVLSTSASGETMVINEVW